MKLTLLDKLIDRVTLDKNAMLSTLKSTAPKIAAIATALTLTLSTTGCNLIPGLDNIIPDLPGLQENQYPQYSTLLNQLLTDSEVNEIIDRAKQTGETNPNDFRTHPYTFLAKKGHNVSRIKSGEVECSTISFIYDNEPNNLYLAVTVEDTRGKIDYDYVAQYLVRYTLTDQEMEEYKMLDHDGYIQSYFMNDTISKHKQAEILAENYIMKEAQENFAHTLGQQDYIKGNGYIYSRDVNILMYNYDTDTNTCNILVMPSNCYGQGKIGIVPLSMDYIQEHNGVYLSPSDREYKLNQDKYGEYRNSIQRAYIIDLTNRPITTDNLLDQE